MTPDSVSESPAAGTSVSDTAANHVLVADLGGTRLRVAVVDASGSLAAKEVIATPEGDPGALVGAMRQVLDKTGSHVAGAVVGVPGPVDYVTGEVLTLPNLPAWEGTLRASRLAEELAMPVRVANDADLAALGEHRFGAGRDTEDMLYVTSSTGVGAGVIIAERMLAARFNRPGHEIVGPKFRHATPGDLSRCADVGRNPT